MSVWHWIKKRFQKQTTNVVRDGGVVDVSRLYVCYTFLVVIILILGSGNKALIYQKYHKDKNITITNGYPIMS